MNNKEALLEELFRCEIPERLQEIWDKLDIYAWETGKGHSPTGLHVASVLERYLQGEVSEQQVEEWAGFIEAADVALGGFGDERVMKIVYELANPSVEGALTPENARQYIEVLG